MNGRSFFESVKDAKALELNFCTVAGDYCLSDLVWKSPQISHCASYDEL